MRELGLAATEFGPDGFLAADPAAKADQLASYGLRAVGGFLPVLLHDPRPRPAARGGPRSSTAVSPPAPASSCWRRTPASTGTTSARCSTTPAGRRCCATSTGSPTTPRTRGVVAALHPHVGTMVETGEETERVLAGSDVGLCVDTGHLLVGGGDPVALTAAHPHRVVHVHLKDVDAARGRAGARRRDRPSATAVRDGMFRPLGEGDVDIAAMVRTLEAAGYDGWYVLEQDVDARRRRRTARRAVRRRADQPRLPGAGRRMTTRTPVTSRC